MPALARKVWRWFAARAHGTHARAWLYFLAFSESSFFLVPPEVLLVPMLAADARRWLWYAATTTVASLAGAAFGYALGYFLFDTVGARIIDFYGLEESFARVGALFENNAGWVMFTAAFTPIPFKVFVLAAGFFNIPFALFFTASLVGRFLRYVVVAWAAHRWGARAADAAIRWANVLTAAAGALVLAALWLWWR